MFDHSVTISNELDMFDHSVTISNELVTLEPMYLDPFIIKHLSEKLCKIKVGTCTKEYGFIKGIKITNVKPAEISMADGSTRFSTTYIIKSILPTVGKVYTAKSVTVINHNNVCCVIATIDDACGGNPFQIFIVNGISKGPNYKFESCKCVIPISDKPKKLVLWNIIVETVQYHQKQFIVAGKHMHDYNLSKDPKIKDDKKGCAKTEVK
jgi:hypothetical protein